MERNTMLEFVSRYSEKFNYVNDDLVKNIREKDNIVMYLNEACIELSKVLPDNIKYLGWEFDDRYRRNKEINKTKDVTGKERLHIINTSFTFSRTAVFKFKISFNDETLIVNMPIYIPQLIDGYHYFIRGSKYSTPFQLVDAVTYTNNRDSVVIKTMVRTIDLTKCKTTIKDINNVVYNTNSCTIIMTKKVPMLLYWFSNFGFFRTFKYFGLDNFVKFYDNLDDTLDDNYIYFKFGAIYIAVEYDRFIKDVKLKEFLGTLFELNKRNLKLENIRSVSYWKTVLGQSISDNNSLSKGESLLRTFITALDYRTKNNLNKLTGGTPKEDTFDVVRWMFLMFEQLSSKSNTLYNKRIRLGEYLITPVVKRLYSKLYQFMNTSHKTKDFKRLHDIFKMQPAIIINAIIGKTTTQLSLNIAQYSSRVNDLTILNMLKITKGGPGSPMAFRTKLLGNKYRNYDSSYVGHISLIATSTSDPGISGGTITPTSDFDIENMKFH